MTDLKNATPARFPCFKLTIMKQIQDFKPEDRFLPLNIYKFPLGNCGGITDHLGRESIYVPNKEGNYKFSELQDELDRIFVEDHRGGDYWALQPLMQPEGVAGPMAGGNLAYSGDSRNRRVYHVHDRFETWETYKALSI